MKVAPEQLPRRITVVTHAVMIDGQDNFGPAHNVVEFLVASCPQVNFVLHPLGRSGTGFHRQFRAGKLVANRIIRYGPAARAREAFYGARLGALDKADVLILVDPLNFATSGFVRRLRRYGVLVYYTADYADHRFENPFLNRVYHALDATAVRTADVVWNVSRRIRDKRRRQGVPDEDNFHISNAPPFDPSAIVQFEERPSESVAMVGSIDRILDQAMLLSCLERLRQVRPQVRVTIIGTGDDEAYFGAEIERRNLAENVQLTGYLPREQALSIVRKTRAGLALYSGAASWTEYCDSVKVREYLSLGVPVVTTGNHGLARELESRGAGFVADDGQQAADAIDALLGPHGAEAAERAAQMGRDYDRDAFLQTALTDLSQRLARRRPLRGRH